MKLKINSVAFARFMCYDRGGNDARCFFVDAGYPCGNGGARCFLSVGEAIFAKLRFGHAARMMLGKAAQKEDLLGGKVCGSSAKKYVFIKRNEQKTRDHTRTGQNGSVGVLFCKIMRLKFEGEFLHVRRVGKRRG